jgi:hypothetical protein
MFIFVCLFVFITFHAFKHINITLELSVISSSTAFDIYFETKTKKYKTNHIFLLANVTHQTTNY